MSRSGESYANVVNVWASTGLTDIHHQGHSPRKDVHL